MEFNKSGNQQSDIVERGPPCKQHSAESDVGSTNIVSYTIKTNAMAATSDVATKTGLRVHSTPRIDISRASSSSQHEDSRDSSPENIVFDQVGTGTLEEILPACSDLDFVGDDSNNKSLKTETKMDVQVVRIN